MRWLVGLLTEGRILLQKIKLVSLDCHMILVALLSEKSPSTALATGLFGLGVDIAFAAAL